MMSPAPGVDSVNDLASFIVVFFICFGLMAATPGCCRIEGTAAATEGPNDSLPRWKSHAGDVIRWTNKPRDGDNRSLKVLSRGERTTILLTKTIGTDPEQSQAFTVRESAIPLVVAAFYWSDWDIPVSDGAIEWRQDSEHKGEWWADAGKYRVRMLFQDGWRHPMISFSRKERQWLTMVSPFWNLWPYVPAED